MKRSNKLIRLLCTAAATLTVAAVTFGGCTSVDDTLGGNLVPDNQQMRAGFLRLPEDAADKTKYLSTRLFQSDSIASANLSSGYFGSQLNDTLGLRSAGFLTQMINLTELDEGYFGYKPIFDSAQLRLSIGSYGRDTITEQRFAIYEVISNKYLTEKPVATGTSQRDTLFYLNFDPAREGVIDMSREPLFYFTLGGDKGPATTAVTLEPTEEGRKYVQRLMLQKGSGTNYEEDYSIYRIDSLEQWVEEFKGFYICPAPNTTMTGGEGTIFATTLESSGLTIYGRNRVKTDPSLIQDTLRVTYYFYEGSVDHGNVSINTMRHDYSQAKALPLDIADAKEPAEGATDNRPEMARLRVEGLGGVVSQITFTDAFFNTLEQKIEAVNTAEGKDFQTLAFSQVVMNIYFNDGTYDWTQISPSGPKDQDDKDDNTTSATENAAGMTNGLRLTNEMVAAPSRLGLYTNYRSRTPIADYNYSYETQYGTTINYGGYINRSQGCYKMNITAYVQSLWNSYIKEKQAAEAEGRAVDLDRISGRTIYLAPEAGGFYTMSHCVLQGMTTDDATNTAPIRLEMTYNMIK